MRVAVRDIEQRALCFYDVLLDAFSLCFRLQFTLPFRQQVRAHRGDPTKP